MIPRGKLLMSMNDPLSILAILLWLKLRMKGKEIREQKLPSRIDVAPWCYKLDGMGLGWDWDGYLWAGVGRFTMIYKVIRYF